MGIGDGDVSVEHDEFVTVTMELATYGILLAESRCSTMFCAASRHYGSPSHDRWVDVPGQRGRQSRSRPTNLGLARRADCYVVATPPPHLTRFGA